MSTQPEQPIKEPLPRLLEDELEEVAWGTYWFGGLASRYHTGNKRLRLLEKHGLIKRVPGVELCDDDGFLVEPVQIRTGWTLTDKGFPYLCAWWQKQLTDKGWKEEA